MSLKIIYLKIHLNLRQATELNPNELAVMIDMVLPAE